MAMRVEETETHRQAKRQRRMNNDSSSSSSSSSLSSLVQLEDLNDDLLIEILCRVQPYKDLMRCKCVRKRWLSLISNPAPYFVSVHRFFSSRKQRPWGFIYRTSIKSGRKIKVTSKDPVFQSQGFSFNFLPCYELDDELVPHNILQSSNDLVLCSPFVRRDFHPAYYLCNPFTMQWVELPPPPPTYRVVPELQFSVYTNEIFVNLICEHGHEHKHGVASVCRFQVVRVHRYFGFNDTLELDVFSSETGQWMKHNVEMLPDKPYHLQFIEKIVTCNGTLFALAFQAHQILAFNLNSLTNGSTSSSSSSSSHDDHDYHLLQLPNVDGAWRGTPVCYQGRLRLLHIKEEDDTVPVLYIWELKEDYENKGKKASDCEYWSLVHHVSVTDMVATNCNEWFLENIAKTGLPRCNGGLRIRALNFQPDDGNILCLSFNDRIASYDMWNKILTFHPKAMSRPIPQVQPPFLQLALPSCPTKIPVV